MFSFDSMVRELSRVSAELLMSLLHLLLLGCFQLVPAFAEHQFIRFASALMSLVQDQQEVLMQLLVARFPDRHIETVRQIFARGQTIVHEITVVHLRTLYLWQLIGLGIGYLILIWHPDSSLTAFGIAVVGIGSAGWQPSLRYCCAGGGSTIFDNAAGACALLCPGIA